MLSSTVLVIVSGLLAAAAPANDWSKPCLDGECAYDIPGRQGSAGVLRIAGSPKAITDITPAAGWVILDCDPHALEQEIRLVCQHDDSDASACAHVFEHWGAEGKLVRLPESCGSGPFARIAQATVAADQSIPHHLGASIMRRDGVAPQVHSFKLDVNFAAIDTAKVGEITFGFVGATDPYADANFEFVDGWFDDAIKGAGNWISGAANTVAGAATTAGKAVAGAAVDAGKAIAGAATSAFEAVKGVPGLLENATHFEFKPTVSSGPLNPEGATTLIDYQAQSCKGTGKLKIDVAGKGTGNARAGVIIEGTIVPPKIKNLAAFAGLSFDVDATLHVSASILGGYDSGKKIIVKPVGLPGLSIPGVLTVGPFVELSGQAKAFLDLNIDSDVHLAYKVENLELWYPPESKPATKRGVRTKQSPLKLKAKAKANAQGFIEGHVIPALKLGVSGLGGKAGADIFLEADVFGRVSVKAEASVTANAKIGATPPPKKGKRRYIPPYVYPRDLAMASSELAGPAATANVKAKFSGCIWLDCGLELRYGVQSQAQGLWDVNKNGVLWTSPVWPIWSTCFAAGTKKGKADKSPWDVNALEAKFRDNHPQCAAGDIGELEEIPDETIPEQNVQA